MSSSTAGASVSRAASAALCSCWPSIGIRPASPFATSASYFDEPIFSKLVKRRTADTIELTNGFALEVATSRGRSVRGRTVIAAILDEVAFFRDESSSNPDTEVYEALKPATATIDGAMIIGISSPYARRGLLWTIPAALRQGGQRACSAGTYMGDEPACPAARRDHF